MVAVSMVDVVTRIAAEMEREKNPSITEAALISRLRRRFQLGRRTERAATDREDIKAILATTQIDLKTLRRKARAEGTIKILEDLLQSKQRHR
jgi:hypothetical protein